MPKRRRARGGGGRVEALRQRARFESDWRPLALDRLAVGAVLGPLGVMETILAASLLGLVLGVGWALAIRKWNAPFGFGPAIAAGALLVVLLPGRIFFPY